MKRIYYNKLIRDKIPEKIAKKGSAYEARKLGAKDFERELLKKVGEEASGLLNARTKDEITSELADVLDVVEEIKRTKRISSAQIRSAQRLSYRTKGGFKKRLFLFWSADDGYKTNERRYAGKKRRASTG
ncbi:nucleoside triphosphate pyrophosphohydrolase [Patescibacteria group bacterium]|nr:nucleoside triphosphate pyrophosphohydrolase [Patescibacteria group bacterium]